MDADNSTVTLAREPEGRGDMMIRTAARGAAGTLVLTLAALFAVPANAQEPPSFTPLPAPSLNFYGLPGLMDMPSGEAMPDGQFALTVSSFGGMTRGTLSFQATPRISGSFRYVGIRNWNSGGFDTYYDRSFDARFLLFRETRRWPAVTVGLQDFAGTGIYSGEYVVATKTFGATGVPRWPLPGQVKLTAGLGWGRLGSAGSIGTLFGADRPGFAAGGTGGKPAVDSWFRGPVAPFAGLEWSVNDRLGLKAEYSSDAYNQESGARNVFDRRSRFNFGIEYQAADQLRLGAYYMYGSEIGLTAQLQLNPRQPVTPLAVAAPRPVLARIPFEQNPGAWSTDWAASTSAPATIRDAVEPLLRDQGVVLESLAVTATVADLRVRNTGYWSMANAVGRAARVMARVLPPSVETFRIVPVSGGLPLSMVTIRRSDLEALEFAPEAAEGLLAVTGISDAPPAPGGTVANPDLYPRFSWAIGPYLERSIFDPDEPIRFDIGVELKAGYRFAPGWMLAGAVRHRLAGNIADSRRLSNSPLPRVRTDTVLYARGGDTTLPQLYLSHRWKLQPDVYARFTAGYLEPMFGGLSAEVLWKPANSRLGLGIEANYVRKRDYDQLLGFQDYGVATGHASAYYQFGDGYLAQIDVGRYLAGDIGTTFSLDREFDNGWRLGGFFTLTDVSAAEFGEGSFDKGIRVIIPVNYLVGRPTPQRIGSVIRPIQRDGGARLQVPGRLYEQVRRGHAEALTSQWPRVWE